MSENISIPKVVHDLMVEKLESLRDTPMPVSAREPNTVFNGRQLVLMDCGNRKIAVLKVIRMLTGWGLADTKRVLDAHEPFIVPIHSDSRCSGVDSGLSELHFVGADVRILNSPNTYSFYSSYGVDF
jgi:ribosomal protein L7/L12